MNKITKTISGIVGALALAFVLYGGASAYTYTRNLTIGATGPDVVALQTFLESRGYLVMPVGVPKGYFGPITQGAVAKLQAANGITPVAGYFGPITRARVAVLEAGSSSNVPGCQPGMAYSPTTGQSCTPSNNNNDDDDDNDNDDLSGSDGSIDDVNKLSQYNNEEVGEGEDEARIAGFEVETSNDGDIALRSIKVSFDPAGNTGSDKLDRYISAVRIMQDDKEIGSADVDDFNDDDDDVYSKTISVDDAIIRSDESERFYIEVDGANNFDSGDLPGSWTVDVDSIRYEDGSGVVTTDSDTGDIDNLDVPIRFVTFSEAADTELKLTTDSDSPDEGVVMVDEDDTTDEVVLLRGNIEVEGDSDILLDELPVTLVTTNAASINDITGTLTLSIDDNDYSESVNIPSTTGVVTFENLDLTLDAGETYEFTISADINEIDAPAFSEGDDLKVSITSANRDEIDAENEEGDQLESSEKSGTVTGRAQMFRTEGIQVTQVGSPSAVSNNSDGADTGTFIIKFKVKAVGDTVYVASLAQNAVTYSVYDSNGVASSSNSIRASIKNETDISKTVVGNYEIEEGEEETFTLTVTVPNGTGDASDQYYVALTGVLWDTEDDTSPSNTYTANLDDFQTPTVFLDNQ